jgi:hypothetical protein
MDGVDQLGPKLRVRAKNFSERQVAAIQAAAQAAKDEIESQGRANIKAGGNFGSERWQEGFQALVSFQSRTDLRIRATHAVSYWRVFEFGAIIHGKPLLWIPLKNSRADVLHVRARDFGQPLFRVDRKSGGAPLLLSKDGPQYFGKAQVRIPQKWHLRDIIKTIARSMGAFYKQAMTNGN